MQQVCARVLLKPRKLPSAPTFITNIFHIVLYAQPPLGYLVFKKRTLAYQSQFLQTTGFYECSSFWIRKRSAEELKAQFTHWREYEFAFYWSAKSQKFQKTFDIDLVVCVTPGTSRSIVIKTPIPFIT